MNAAERRFGIGALRKSRQGVHSRLTACLEKNMRLRGTDTFVAHVGLSGNPQLESKCGVDSHGVYNTTERTKMKRLLMFSLLFATCALLAAQSSSVSFSIGPTSFREGDVAVIESISATSSNFVAGDTVTVRGEYT